uniref:hypothetical protein n=1 Tax=Thalassotalea sp. PLHSN55 TaxID=3435888 RepID=UPI003F86A2DE
QSGNVTAKKVESKPKDSPVREAITKLAGSDLGKIFINCSQTVSDGRFDYCFNNEQGEVVDPELVGYKVLYQSDCHSKLKRGNLVLDVYCNPVRKQYDPITINSDS